MGKKSDIERSRCNEIQADNVSSSSEKNCSFPAGKVGAGQAGEERGVIEPSASPLYKLMTVGRRWMVVPLMFALRTTLLCSLDSLPGEGRGYAVKPPCVLSRLYWLG